MEQEYEENVELPTAVPEKKKRTLTPKQLKNLELMRQKKMAKKKATEMIEDSVRNSAKESEIEELSNLKNELYELKASLKNKSKPRNIPQKRKKVEIESESDEEEQLGTSYNESSIPYLNQIVRFK